MPKKAIGILIGQKYPNKKRRSVTLVTQGPIIFKQPVFLILIANVFALF